MGASRNRPARASAQGFPRGFSYGSCGGKSFEAMGVSRLTMAKLLKNMKTYKGSRKNDVFDFALSSPFVKATSLESAFNENGNVNQIESLLVFPFVQKYSLIQTFESHGYVG